MVTTDNTWRCRMRSGLTKSYNGDTSIGGRSRSVSPEVPRLLQSELSAPRSSVPDSTGKVAQPRMVSAGMVKGKSTASNISAVLQSLTAEQTAELQAALAARAPA